MHSRKVKELLPAIAVQIGQPEDLVQAVNNFYWDSTRKALANAPKLKVHLPNLGDFTIKHWVLDPQIERLSRIKEGLEAKPRLNYHLLTSITEKLNQLVSLKIMKGQEDQRKEFIHEFKSNRNENITDIIADLEE
jgi:hypothetical protein